MFISQRHSKFVLLNFSKCWKIEMIILQCTKSIDIISNQIFSKSIKVFKSYYFTKSIVDLIPEILLKSIVDFCI